MSANILLSILPGGLAPQPNGASAPVAGGDAAAFLALLGGAVDVANPHVRAAPVEGAVPTNIALALQTLPENARPEIKIAPEATPQAAPLVPEAEEAMAPPQASPVAANKTPSQDVRAAKPDAPQTDDPELIVPTKTATADSVETSVEAANEQAPQAARKAATDAELTKAPETPPPTTPQPTLVAVAATPAPPPRTANTPSGERKIDPNGTPAPQREGPLAPEAETAPDGAPKAEVQADARGAKAAPQTQAKADAPSAAQAAANTGAPMPVATSDSISGIARAEQAAPAPADAAQSARAGQLGPAATSVAQQIVRRFDGGTTRFEIRLDPAELGRVDVRLEVTRDKKVTATISAENQQTLQELVRSSRELQRVLADAGLDLADNGLTFSERREDASANFENDGELRGRESRSGEEEAAPVEQRRLGVERWGGSRVDVWV